MPHTLHFTRAAYIKQWETQGRSETPANFLLFENSISTNYAHYTKTSSRTFQRKNGNESWSLGHTALLFDSALVHFHMIPFKAAYFSDMHSNNEENANNSKQENTNCVIYPIDLACANRKNTQHHHPSSLSLASVIRNIGKICAWLANFVEEIVSKSISATIIFITKSIKKVSLIVKKT